MIIPIKNRVDWELIRQRRQTKTNKDNIRENNNRVDHDYKGRGPAQDFPFDLILWFVGI